jgi:hypothetical protein
MRPADHAAGAAAMKVLKSYEFAEAVGKAVYDWDTLLDGKIRQLEAGTDYQCKDATFGMMARKQGRKRGKAVRVGKVEGGLVIQAVEASEEQLAKWKAEQEGESEHREQ